MFRAAVLCSLLAPAAACGDTAIRQPGDAGVVDAGVSPSCLEAEDHSDLTWIQDNVFTPSCSRFSACHRRSATSAAGLNLEPGMAAMNLIGATSRVCGAPQIMVVPGEPENSYLMKVLGSYDLPVPGSAGCPDADPDEPLETMPYNNPLLCQQKRDAIERWIVELANPPDAGVPDASLDDGAPADAEVPDAAVDAG